MNRNINSEREVQMEKEIIAPLKDRLKAIEAALAELDNKRVPLLQERSNLSRAVSLLEGNVTTRGSGSQGKVWTREKVAQAQEKIAAGMKYKDIAAELGVTLRAFQVAVANRGIGRQSLKADAA